MIAHLFHFEPIHALFDLKKLFYLDVLVHYQNMYFL